MSSSPPTKLQDPITDALAAAIAAKLLPQIAELIAEHSEGAPSADALIDTSELAQRLGVSTPTARRMELPHVMCGDHRRYHWPTVLDHLRAQRGGR